MELTVNQGVELLAQSHTLAEKTGIGSQAFHDWVTGIVDHSDTLCFKLTDSFLAMYPAPMYVMSWNIGPKSVAEAGFSPSQYRELQQAYPRRQLRRQ